MVKKILISLVLLILVGGGCLVYFYNRETQAFGQAGQKTLFEVKANEPMESLLKRMEEEKIIKNAFFTSILARVKGLNHLYAGKFYLDPSLDSEGNLAILNDPSQLVPDVYRMTFIEGRWARSYAKDLATRLGLDEKDILDYWNDPKNLTRWKNTYPVLADLVLDQKKPVQLEGYLFANTYEFFEKDDLEKITETLLSHTNQFYEDHRTLFDKSSLSPYQIFTLASIIQGEGLEEDMGQISGVFWNRLRDGWKLESSATICYALYDFDHWTACELNTQVDSAYNTYQIMGLPLGPINSPSKSALLAALDPEKTENYFFVSDVKGDGRAHFARTYEEHVKNVKKYLEGLY